MNSRVHAQVRDGLLGEALTSAGALRAWVADAAVCAWSNQWAAANRDDAADDQAEAVEAILKAPTWPAVTAIDPDPYRKLKTQEVTDESGTTREEKYWDESQFYYLAALGEAVQGRDVSAVAALLAENNGQCQPELVPDIPHANPRYNAEHGDH